jgi:hypothetical protein
MVVSNSFLVCHHLSEGNINQGAVWRWLPRRQSSAARSNPGFPHHRLPAYRFQEKP